jgi:hypothetical protein
MMQRARLIVQMRTSCRIQAVPIYEYRSRTEEVGLTKLNAGVR